MVAPILGLFGGGLGPAEMGLIALALLLLFGGRLPEVARSLGKGIVEFKRGLKDVQTDIDGAGDSKSDSDGDKPAG